MKNHEIESLLEKFWAAEASLEEEKILHDYFNSGAVAEELKPMVPYFTYFHREKTTELTPEVWSEMTHKLPVETSGGKGRILQLLPILWKIAAAAAIIAGAWFVVPQWLDDSNQHQVVALEDSYEDPVKAYEEAKAALLLVSNKMKKGTSVADKNLGRLKKASIFKSDDKAFN